MAFLGRERERDPEQGKREEEKREEIVRQMRSRGASDQEIADSLNMKIDVISGISGQAADFSQGQIDVAFAAFEAGAREGGEGFFEELQALEAARSIEAGAAVNTGQGLSSSLSTAQR